MDVSVRSSERIFQDSKDASSLQGMLLLQEEEEEAKDEGHEDQVSEISHFSEDPKPLNPTSMMIAAKASDEEFIQVRDRKKKLKNVNRKRVVQKNGLTNVSYKNISKKRRRYFNDLYTTLLDSSWNYCVLLFAASFFGSWMFFAIIYYMIAYLHGDLQQNNSDWIPCILEIDGFSAAFLFSLETQHTIGYGGRQTTTKCSDAIIIVSLQVGLKKSLLVFHFLSLRLC